MTMNLKSAVILTVASTVLSGCVWSLHPYYLDDAITHDDRIVGRWEEFETSPFSKEIPNSPAFGEVDVKWTIKRTKRNGYSLLIQRGEDTTIMDLVLFEVGDILCADVAEQADPGKAQLMLHSLYMMKIEPDSLILYPIVHRDELFAAAQRNGVECRELQGKNVFTAESESLYSMIKNDYKVLFWVDDESGKQHAYDTKFVLRKAE